MPGELLVRCQDLEEPEGFYNAYRRRLQAGFRFVYDDPRLGTADALPTLLARIREMEAPPEFLSLIARDASPRIRAAAAGNGYLTHEDILALARDDDPLVRRGVAVHPWATPAVLRELARDQASAVREQVAMHLATPPDVLLSMTHDVIAHNMAVEALVAIAEHPRTPEPALTLLALIPFRDGWLVAQRRDLPRTTIERILELGPERCRAELGRNPSIAHEFLDRLARDSAPPVRIAVVRNPSTAPDSLASLLHDPDPAVRAAHPHSTALDLLRLIDVRARAVTEQVASNPYTPANLLDRLARTWDSDVHAAVAANPSAAPETLRHLFQAGGDLVRRLCLENSACPEDLLRSRARSQMPQWRAMVAANIATPRDVLESLSSDEEPEVLAALAGNRMLATALQRRLLHHPSALPADPLTPPELLWQLAMYENDDHFRRRRRVLANPTFAQAYESVASWRD